MEKPPLKLAAAPAPKPIRGGCCDARTSHPAPGMGRGRAGGGQGQGAHECFDKADGACEPEEDVRSGAADAAAVGPKGDVEVAVPEEIDMEVAASADNMASGLNFRAVFAIGFETRDARCGYGAGITIDPRGAKYACGPLVHLLWHSGRRREQHDGSTWARNCRSYGTRAVGYRHLLRPSQFRTSVAKLKVTSNEWPKATGNSKSTVA
ncbi:hypothetical protein GALMADRAFT_216861 [Galerina marginata CBS 339.88]|uniref:Uncharacterized protein n=1 Tax=Galerina marginata (strain CBS 339.88) TaxID=685588 RepID=A0A067SIP8_GALM3|nr:hypothetical protein GALMADRAFT_216861 [Galerina marginata CBS 339.88]